MRCRLAAITVSSLLLTGVVACGGAGEDGSGGSSPAGSDLSSPGATAPPSPRPRPAGPAATITGPLTGGSGISLASAGAGPALGAAGYDEAEYTAAGTAISYTAEGELPTDGTYVLRPGPTAGYTTRIVVRRPRDPRAFNGTVAVEWLNVSGGIDAAPDFTYLAAELLRKGYAWVGVSAQRIGVEGGAVAVRVPGAEEAGAGRGLRAIDPARYGSLSHPGDAFAYDMYTQVARALLASGAEGPLAGLGAQRLLAVGESQSAFLLTTYYNGVQPLTQAFDGFLIHSRGGAAASLGTPGGGIDIAGSIGGRPTRLRTDLTAPAIVVQTETDVLGILGYYAARQPDAEHLRIWEVAGAAHADEFQVGDRGAALGCTAAINRGQQVFVLRAALRHLQAWVTGGDTPPPGAPLAVDTATTPPAFALDDVGNVKGGVRTPAVDAPVDVLSGLAAKDSSIICLLFGTTVPIPAEALRALHPSPDAYLDDYTAATDAGIRTGFLLAEDRAELLAGASPGRITADGRRRVPARPGLP